jgi:hypothetical protein
MLYEGVPCFRREQVQEVRYMSKLALHPNSLNQ